MNGIPANCRARLTNLPTSKISPITTNTLKKIFKKCIDTVLLILPWYNFIEESSSLGVIGMTYPRELIDPIIAKNADFDLEGFVFGNGDFTPDIMLIGEAPGEVEIRTGIPFTGRSGKELDKTLAIAGLTRDQVYITSIVRSRPFGRKMMIDKTGKKIVKRPNRMPKTQEILLHAPLLDYEISQVKPKLIVALGGCALKRLIDNKMTISESHGRVWHGKIKQIGPNSKYVASEQEYHVFPTFHPAAIFYNRKIATDLMTDWEKLKEILAKKTF